MPKKKAVANTSSSVQVITVDQLRANELNPNEMTSEEFSFLVQNIKEIQFVEPPLVVPVLDPKGDVLKYYRIVSGAHRTKAAIEAGLKEIPCMVGDPEVFDEEMQVKQLVRMNKIKGHLNIQKFNDLVDHAIEKGYIDIDNAAAELGFADEEEFTLMRDALADSLSSPSQRKEFLERAKDAKTADDLLDIVNKLMAKFGDTLPANYMIIDIGTKKHLWVRIDARRLNKFRAQAQTCLDAKVTFESYVVSVLEHTVANQFIEKHKGELAELTEEYLSIDDFFLSEPIDEEVSVVQAE